jgi:5-methylcytosine-specific restriction endonuclease McrA
MSHRPGVLSRAKNRVKRGKESPRNLEYLLTLLKDPCVYCGELGSDSLDHIVPIAKIELLNTNHGKDHWSNLAPCHKSCNFKKKDKEIIHVKLEQLSKHLRDGPPSDKGPPDRGG